MCSHYQPVKDKERMSQFFAVALPEGSKPIIWPGYMGPFLRRHPYADVGDDAVPAFESLPGMFGLVPHWSKDTKIAKHTYNARTETVAEKPSFRQAWSRRQHCIIPAEAIYEPDWRGGKAVVTRIERADGEPMGIAGLWSCWKSDKGEVYSYTMLTVNADHHSLMRNFHRPTEEKRMVVILEPQHYADWLAAAPDRGLGYLTTYPAERLVANPSNTPQPREGVLFS